MHSFKWVSVWSGERLHYWQLCKFKLIALCTNLSVTGVTPSPAAPQMMMIGRPPARPAEIIHEIRPTERRPTDPPAGSLTEQN